jgi:hypothetical protein
LSSFAAITDEPAAEIAAAGHDRCIIPTDLDAQCSILDDRERPLYQHQLAA